MNFDQALNYLLSLGHETLAIKFGLDNTLRLLEALGQPQRIFFKVQIAGTNGKGSTAAMLDSITRAAGINTALYTSPHLISITERMRFNGLDIDPAAFARIATEVRDAAQSLVSSGSLAALPTFFEHLTAMFFLGCRDAWTELAILETGLGGRLDSTTAAMADIVAITPIALDHQEYLGNTLSEIAAEKAAIIRPGVMAIIATQPDEAMSVILERCADCSIEPRLAEHQLKVLGADKQGRLLVTFKTELSIYEDVRLSLLGRHQAVNASVALELAEALRERGFTISSEAIVAGLESASHPGRLERLDGEPEFLFDGAHNAAGAEALRSYLDEFNRKPLTLIFSAMRDKDLHEMAATLFPAAERLILTEMNNPRSVSTETLEQLASHHVAASRTTMTGNVNEAIRAARDSTASDGLICVTGSLYLIGEVRALLQHEGPRER